MEMKLERKCNCGCSDLKYEKKGKDEYGSFKLYNCPNCEGIILEYYDLAILNSKGKKRRKSCAY
jgi:hypothetical protein